MGNSDAFFRPSKNTLVHGPRRVDLLWPEEPRGRGPEGGLRVFQVTLDEFIVKFAAGNGRAGLLCEISSNATLAPKFALKSDQEAAILAEEFIDSGENRGYLLNIEQLDPVTLRDLALKTEHIFQDIYRCPYNCSWEFSLYLRRPPPTECTAISCRNPPDTISIRNE